MQAMQLRQIGGPLILSDLPDQLQRRREAGEVAEAGNADEPHRHADRHAQQHQHEQRYEADDGDGVSALDREVHTA